MIHVQLRPLAGSRNKGCLYEAACEFGGITYSALSRYGASHELARILVAEGVADSPMAVRQDGLNGEITYPSFHEAAKWTYEESAAKSLRRVRWEDPAVKRARIAAAFGEKQGSSDIPGRVAALVD